MTRYILQPGYVISQIDNGRHFIGYDDLRILYRLPPNARVVFFGTESRERAMYREEPTDIVLRPDPSGRYELPAAKAKTAPLPIFPTKRNIKIRR